MGSRGLISQAQGLLMERYGLTGDGAMHYLRRTSQDLQRRVRDLAEQLITEHDRDRAEGLPGTDPSLPDDPVDRRRSADP
jgi:hypothetical protein